jgi:hypothetical protein
MKTAAQPMVEPNQPGDHLSKLVKSVSCFGLLFSLIGTGLAWGGSRSLNSPAIVWQAGLVLNLIVFMLTWLAYLPFRRTDLLLGNGLLSGFFLLAAFWTFGFGGFYFYFLFAPISIICRGAVLVVMTGILVHRCYQTVGDIQEAFTKDKHLFRRMYFDEDTTITFTREAMGMLEKARKNRKPFKSFHMYAALIVTPFVLVLNRVLTPFIGDGHGVFLFLSFFAAPMLLWLSELLAQTVVTMIYYPIKLQRETGKPVLIKNW